MRGLDSCFGGQLCHESGYPVIWVVAFIMIIALINYLTTKIRGRK